MISILRNNKSLLMFILCGGLLAGVVFLGVLSSFILMLFEQGVNSKSIAIVSFATFPYSWKFLITPYIKNIIKRYSVKYISIITQLVIFILFISLGIYANNYNTVFAVLHVFLLITSMSVQDILCTYVKLNNFDRTEYGIVLSVSNTGFRLGMLLGGAGLLYFAEKISWSLSFLLTISMVIVLSLISTCMLPNTSIINTSIINTSIINTSIINTSIINTQAKQIQKVIGIKDLINMIFKFIKSYKFWLLIIVIISIKIPDASINICKNMFLSYKGFDKISISQISQIPGVIAMILSGFVAGVIAYKFDIIKCMCSALLLQILPSLMFLYLNHSNLDKISVAIAMIFLSLILGYSNIVYRTFIDKESQGDININILLNSIGALFRSIFASIAIIIVGDLGWNTLYLYCTFSVIPGIIILMRRPFKFLNT